ncbi:MAG: phage terminase small subunit P27 family [Terriglobales bacterium]
MAMPRKSLSEHKLNNTTPAYVEPDTFIPSGRPKYPKNISGEAKAAFKRLSRMLEARRSLTPSDQEILALYAHLYSRHQRALAAIEREGEIRLYTRLNNRGEDVQCEKPNLWLKVAETCEAKMIACLSALGMTPMNRSKVKPTEQPKLTPPDEGTFVVGEHNFSREEELTPQEWAVLQKMRGETPVEPEPDIDLSTIDETVVI